ncbi:hypothetical protein BT96DRAFT_39723 [Gymnopus androsaceus JB14]|uniref:DRBM domain-containing protein n=1 Tax=Gymnopus androsaceus JB14 TaxID=1447944 RepID=A0A6A4GDF9_9AGAR|nr:hypothetical protein BT96DRAFT_39723 [Gymnopus androsaceus JB14]
MMRYNSSVYEPSIRKRAFQVIMGIVGGMDFEDLAFAVSEWHPSESHDLLKEMVLCFRLENGSDETGRLPSSYIQSQNSNTSKEAPLCNAFLLFIALVISFSQTPSFSKLVIHELDVLAFIAQTFPATVLNADSEFDSSIQNPLLPAKLVFCTLLEKLDPTVDSLDAPSIAQLTVILSTTALNSVSLEHVHPLRTVIHRYHHTRERRHSGHGNQHSNVTGDVHILNTVIQRYHYTKEFKDSHHGSEFFGYWLSIVYINNREYGRAIGRTRGEAREHAAHQALLVFHL